MKNPYNLVLITGGSSGIGLALAKKLVAAGSSVWILARDAGRLETASSELTRLRATEDQVIGTLQVDVADDDAVFEQLGKWISQTGCPDLVINSAGVVHPGYFTELEPERFRWMMDINYFGSANICRTVVPEMMKRRSGHVVNLCSVAGFLGTFGYTAYSASKFAIRGFTEALRSEMKPYGIKVSIVYPPDTDTPQLAYENQYKPFETRALSGHVKPLSADAVADEILKGVIHGRYTIVPGFDGKLTMLLNNLLGDRFYTIIDGIVAGAQKKKQQEKSSQPAD